MHLVPLLTLTLAGLLAGCAHGAGPDRRVQQVVAGQPVVLAIGQQARLPAGAVQLGFEAVLSDSRCPKGERCIQAGEAVLQLWLQAAGGVRQPLVLHTGPGAASTAPVALQPGQQLRLLQLAPYPVAGRTVATTDWRATLLLEAGDGGAAER